MATLAHDLAKVCERAERARDISLGEVEEETEGHVKTPSGLLAGILGGIIGGAGGIWFGAAGAGAATLNGPLGMVAGAALAVLVYRGPKWLKLERSGRMLEASALVIKHQLEDLPDDTPPEVRNEFWNQYREIMRKYVWVATESI